MKRNILIIGKTNSGKSSLGNLLINKKKEIFKVSSGSESQTKWIQTEEFSDNEGVDYKVIDTTGIGNRLMRPIEVLRAVIDGCKEFKDGVHQVLFVLSGRFTNEEIYAFNIVNEVVFEGKAIDYTTIVRTKFEDFETPEECKKDIQKLLEEGSEEVVKMFRSCKRVIHVNNPTMNSELAPRKVKLNKEERDLSRKILIEYLENCQQPCRSKNLDKINDELDEHLIKKGEKLKKELSEVEEKLEILERGESLTTDEKQENLVKKRHDIKELIRINDELIEKNLWKTFEEIVQKIIQKLTELKDITYQAYDTAYQASVEVVKWWFGN